MLRTAHPAESRLRLGLLAPALALSALLAGGCNSSSSPDQGTSLAGTIGTAPGTSRYFIVDENRGGLGSELRVKRLAWGRLVDVYGYDATGRPVLMNENFVIAPSLDSSSERTLETHPVTAAQRLIIHRNVEDDSPGGGLEQFHDELRLAEAAIEPVFDEGLGGSGHFTMVPRNACVVIQFDDLLDPEMVDGSTVQVSVGSPSIQPFEARVLVDPNHGDLADHDGLPGLEYYTTRVLVDMTVSEVESFLTDPPLPVNTLGLPASANTNLSNVQIDLPTRIHLPSGHDRILRNPTGHELATAANGTVDSTRATQPVARAFRSGGPFDVTADPFNGFLRDSLPPRVVGVFRGDLDSVLSDPLETDPSYFRIGFTFDSEYCAQAPAVGDTLTQSNGVFAEVVEPALLNGKEVSDLKVRLVTFPETWANGPATWEAIGPSTPAQYLSPFEAGLDGHRPECFVQVTPAAPNPEEPTTGISSTATLSLRFNEPMDPSRVNAFDAITVTREPEATASHDYVVGALGRSQDLFTYHFQSTLPLAHTNGNTESYYLNLVPADPSPNRLAGPVDFSGHELQEVFPQVELVLNSVTTESENGGRASFFTTPDEEEPIGHPKTGATLAEWGGQHLFDLVRGVIRPRPVVHFQAIVDREDVEMIQAMTPTLVGSQTPLSPYGSRSQLLWRHMDLDLDLIDFIAPDTWEVQETLFNLDVTGLSWAPFGGEVNPETYPEFEMLLSHTGQMPDESTGAGLGVAFENNLLSLSEDPQRVVHERHQGYSIHPGDIYVVNQGLRLIPYPMNTQVSPDDYRYFTYRDTAKRMRGGDGITGSPTVNWYQAKNIPVPCENSAAQGAPPNCQWDTGCTFWPFYPEGEVQTVGLPLLMEFRCWPSQFASGTNYFDTSTAAAGSFRAHITGGIDSNLDEHFIEPGIEDEATGGFDPNSSPSGATTPPTDGEVYLGAADFVVRVSRSHSIWFAAVDPESPGTVFSNPAYSEPTYLPGPLEQPLGTSVDFDFRGALAVTEDPAKQDAASLDLYGDYYIPQTSSCGDGSFKHNLAAQNTAVAFQPNEDTWFDQASSIAGAQFYQVRITWTANPISGLVPELSSFGMTWTQQ